MAQTLTRGISSSVPFAKNYGPARMHFSVPAGPRFCFSVLVEIRQNIFRLCGQSIGTGGGQLCFAPEAPENAQSGQTGIVSRKDVYVAVAHEKGALRVCAEVSHQRVDASRVGLSGYTGAAAPHQRKAVRAEVVLDDLSTKSICLVRKLSLIHI